MSAHDEELAAVIAQRLAALYEFVGEQMDNLEPDPKHEQLRDLLFNATGSG